MRQKNGETRPVRWGILGTGYIARLFAQALRSMDDAELTAVGSRSKATADAFAAEFGVRRAHGSYAALAADPEVEIVYVATPHALHMDNSILCLDAGKAVLCEKPFTINRAQSEEVIRAAARNKRFLMEAMWTRFIPAVRQAAAWIGEGAIGEVRMAQASFGFRDHEEKMYNPALGGGSLLDVGIYPITLAHIAFGRQPTHIESMAYLGRGGVDEQAGMLLGYDGGGIAVLASAIQTLTPHEAFIMGTEGMIKLHGTFWNATEVSLIPAEGEPRRVSMPFHCNGYEYEAREAQECLRADRLESETVPHRITLDMMETLDAIRRQWGLRYPME